MTNESDYVVRNPKLVMSYLSDIVKKKCIISAHFGLKNSSFLTTIVEYDKNNNVLMLDCGPNASLDDELLASSKVLFRTDFDGIKASFSGKNIRKVKKGNTWSFSMPIPTSIFWMQRRQYYRVKIPLSHTGSYCQVRFKAENEGEQDQIVNFPLYDLSLSGVAFLDGDPTWSAKLQPQTAFVDCKLHLQTGAEADIAFTVMDVIEIRASATSTQLRVGCHFDYLPPNFDNQIQRYMQEIELLFKNIG